MNRFPKKSQVGDSPTERREIRRGIHRREFLGASAGILAAATGFSLGCSSESDSGTESSDEGRETVASLLETMSRSDSSVYTGDPWPISLAQWSLHREHFGDWVARGEWGLFGERLQSDPGSLLGGPLDPLEFPATARELGFSAVEYVNTFFFDKAQDVAYLKELRQRCSDSEVRSLLIMCDALGSTGDPSTGKRKKAVENHFEWIDAAAFLGCHSVRVNAYSEGSYEEQQERVADGLRQLCEYADSRDVNVLVENHGGLSSDAGWLVGVMEKVDHPRVGTPARLWELQGLRGAGGVVRPLQGRRGADAPGRCGERQVLCFRRDR